MPLPSSVTQFGFSVFGVLDLGSGFMIYKKNMCSPNNGAKPTTDY